MGIMMDGEWRADGSSPAAQGHFVRAQSGFRDWVTRTGDLGPSGDGGFKAEPGRYHLYISLACPWAHRTLIFSQLKRLDGAISLSVVDPFMGENGWAFTAPDGTITPGSTRDEINHAHYLYEIYAKATGQSVARITEDCDRNKWLDDKEMIEYGLIDKVLTSMPHVKRDTKPE